MKNSLELFNDKILIIHDLLTQLYGVDVSIVDDYKVEEIDHRLNNIIIELDKIYTTIKI